MAIWQVNLNFKIQKELNFFDTDFNNSLHALSNVLPETTSWSDSIKQYGLLDSTCIEILLDEKTFYKNFNCFIIAGYNGLHFGL